ncbi:MAG: hypothetical protein AB1782_13350 [Cyanobacteriota bacterium]
MQDIIYTGWSIILITTIVLGIAHIGINKNTIKFHFPTVSLPLTLLCGVFFWCPLFFFNQEMDILSITIPFVIGILLSLVAQCMQPKSELFVSTVCFLVVLLIYKMLPDNMFFILAMYILGFFVGAVLRLLRAERYSGNLLTTVALLLPIYAGFVWNKSIDIPASEFDKRIFLMLVITVLAFIYAFSLNFLQDDKKGLKRLGTLVVATLVIYLVFANILNLSVDYIYLVVAAFGFAQLLEGISSKASTTINSKAFDVIAGLSLILIVGFIVTRIFGIWGLIIISLCCQATTSYKSEKLINWPVIASLFFASKALVHVFIQQTTLNVTGLNLNHPYVYVGLMIGLFIPFLILGFTSVYYKKFTGVNVMLLILMALFTPLLSSYIIHCEASGAMVLGLSVSALILTIAGKILGEEFENKEIKIVSNAMLPLTGLIALMLISTQDLIIIGNIATRETRAVSFITVALITGLYILSQYRIKDHSYEEFYPEEG